MKISFVFFKSGTPFDGYKSYNGGYITISHQETPVLITDMTEVYKLFPEEKPIDPDKIVKKKYTLEELVDDKIIVYIDSEEEFNKIKIAGKKYTKFCTYN